MNGLLLLTIFCAGITVLTGGLLVFSLRRRVSRRTLALLSALVVLLSAGAAGLPFLSAFNRFSHLKNWQVIGEKRATAEEVRLLRESFPGMTGQADREIYHRSYGKFMLAITTFETEAEAKSFWEFRRRQTMNAQLYNGPTHIEIYSRRPSLTALIWAQFKPDPAIRHYAALVTQGVHFLRLIQEIGIPRDNIKYLYTSWSNYGHLSLLVPETPRNIPEHWFMDPRMPEVWINYTPNPDSPDRFQKILAMMLAPIPKQFCPPEILRL